MSKSKRKCKRKLKEQLEAFESRLTGQLENRLRNSHILVAQGVTAASEGPYYITDEPTITFDDCRVMKFDCGGSGGQWAFVKEGKESWVETLKYAHREGEDVRICTNFDSLQDDPNLPYLPVSITPG
jgi:hypothetical protein